MTFAQKTLAQAVRTVESTGKKTVRSPIEDHERMGASDVKFEPVAGPERELLGWCRAQQEQPS